MELLAPTPTAPASADRFTGPVWVDSLATGRPPSRLRLAVVRFAPASRTAWHRHAVGQTLHVQGGLGIVESRDGDVLLLRPGDTIQTPPGEWHWHGALSDRFMSHLAVSETAADPDVADVDWGEHVSETEYLTAVRRVHPQPATRGDHDAHH